MNEVERIAELEEWGFEETGIECPVCSCEVMIREREIFLPDAGKVVAIDMVCPCCNYRDMVYDA